MNLETENRKTLSFSIPHDFPVQNILLGGQASRVALPLPSGKGARSLGIRALVGTRWFTENGNRSQRCYLLLCLCRGGAQPQV